MSFLFLHAINAEFRSRDDGAEYSSPEHALAAGVRDAAALAVDEIYKGKANVAVEMRVEQPDGTPLLRSVVSIVVAPLLLPA